ncbi:MAG: ATP synthase F1 subunit gamma [Patescibacteria group bacterium]|nr:ATP synthase F1 subunit gamma [Patescibacteria group bacterium]MCL5095339.1 ATP synthase F1 subunit gamma [Patescibacteria group bacterium]
MANIRLIKRRIRSARNISQITRAMEMVAASRMKKAQEKAVSGKPYAQKIYEITGKLAKRIKADKEISPLLKQEGKEQKNLVILISTNKGLCGGLNTNLFRSIRNWFPKEVATDYITLGKKGEVFIVRSGRNLVADFSETSFLENIGAVTNLAVAGFVQNKYNQVYLVFNNFFSILKQIPTKQVILPIDSLETEELKTTDGSDLMIEPDANSFFNSLLPYYLEVQVRAAILEAEASEYSARMMAMKAATDNAKELMSLLSLEYNKIRQQLITYEIADIVTAREAMQ